MHKTQFVYVTYIKTNPKKLWDALLRPEFTRKYWFGIAHDCAWKAGSKWKLVTPDGTALDTGKVIKIEKPKRLVLRWRNEFRSTLKAEGYSTCTIELEPEGNVVKLTITHEMNRPKSKFINAVSSGWPHILSSLKSLLETGKPLPGTSSWD